jgi:hypothetical protein
MHQVRVWLRRRRLESRLAQRLGLRSVPRRHVPWLGRAQLHAVFGWVLCVNERLIKLHELPDG